MWAYPEASSTSDSEAPGEALAWTGHARAQGWTKAKWTLAVFAAVSVLGLGLAVRGSSGSAAVAAEPTAITGLEVQIPKQQECDFFVFSHVGNPNALDGYLKYPLEDLLEGGKYRGIMVMYVMPKKEWSVMLQYVKDVVAKGAAHAKLPKELDALNRTCHEKMEKADKNMQRLHRLRILSPLDFKESLLSIRWRLGHEIFQKWFGHTTYDAPKLIDSIMRLRTLGNDVPVFRFDIDVICSKYTKTDMSSIKTAVEHGVGEFTEAVDDPRVQSFVLSQQYSGVPAAKKDEFSAWNEAFSTRANPALLATPALCNASQWSPTGSWGNFLPSPAMLTQATDAETMMMFYGLEDNGQEMLQTPKPSTAKSQATRLEEDIMKLGNTYIGANPTHAIISGAALSTGPGVTLDMPPFLHTDLNIMWVDDHCLDKATQEVMGTKRFPRPPGTGQARVVKARAQPRNPAKYTLELYMPTLTYGIVLDKWINARPDSYLLKYSRDELPHAECLDKAYENLMPDIDGRAEGVFTRAMQKVRTKGQMLTMPEIANFTQDLYKDACSRLQDVYWQWSKMPKPEVDGISTPTFASLWATGRICKHPGLEKYCSNPGFSKLGQGLVSQAWDETAQQAESRSKLPALTTADLNPAMAAKLDDLIKTATTHLMWLLEWPDVVQAIRDENVGLLPSDISWHDKESVPGLRL